MSNYTKGPWGLTEDALSIRSSHTTENGHTSNHICSMDNYRKDRLEEKKPNAALIAAAPDMLEALEAMHNIASEGVTPSLELVCRINSMAKQAIAKAKGGTE